ncbi:MAG: dTDP-4-dehydrorhamnose reductase [Xanthomonadales bacterium]|nr:dTDP-4-dehydrorhamnose reductase [Xanthomonadales bacterium]
MKILLLGAQGQLGHELLRVLHGQAEVRPVARQPIPGWPETLVTDLASAARWDQVWPQFDADLIINAAAYTAVDAAEDDVENAELLNQHLPASLAQHAANTGAKLIHVSTDYVFPGDADQPYQEHDRTGPSSVYGRTKLAGEQAILNSAADALIVRTSWVYSGRRQNFVRAMLSRMLRQQPLKVVADQYGCPTWARDLAQGLAHVAQSWPQVGTLTEAEQRVFHLAGADMGSWYDFAQHIAQAAVELKLLAEAPELSPITTTEFPVKAPRPAWSVLDSSRFAQQFGYRAGGWKSLYACLEELKEARCWFP